MKKRWIKKSSDLNVNPECGVISLFNEKPLFFPFFSISVQGMMNW